MFRLIYNIRTPLLLLILILGIEILASNKIIPSFNELSGTLKLALKEHGLIMMGPLAFLENIAGLNVYFPGSVIILTTMALTGGDPIKGLLTYIIYYASAFAAYHVNFFFGRAFRKKGNVNSSAQTAQMNRAKMWVRFLTTFWHPQTASLTCVHVGSDGYRYSQIFPYLIVSSFIWNTFWGLTMYYVGIRMGSNINFDALAYIYLFGWLLISIYQYYKKETAHRGELVG